MPDEHSSQIQLAQKRFDSLYELLRAPELKDQPKVKQYVDNIEEAVKEIPASSIAYKDAEVLRDFGTLAPKFSSLFVALDGNNFNRG